MLNKTGNKDDLDGLVVAIQDVGDAIQNFLAIVKDFPLEKASKKSLKRQLLIKLEKRYLLDCEWRARWELLASHFSRVQRKHHYASQKKNLATLRVLKTLRIWDSMYED